MTRAPPFHAAAARTRPARGARLHSRSFATSCFAKEQRSRRPPMQPSSAKPERWRMRTPEGPLLGDSTRRRDARRRSAWVRCAVRAARRGFITEPRCVPHRVRTDWTWDACCARRRARWACSSGSSTSGTRLWRVRTQPPLRTQRGLPRGGWSSDTRARWLSSCLCRAPTSGLCWTARRGAPTATR